MTQKQMRPPPSIGSGASMNGVLVVDDNPSDRDALASTLRDRGFEIRTAASPVDALRMLSSFRPAAMVIEPVLAGQDGFGGCDLARLVRRLSWGERVNLLALTGYGHPECQARCRMAGFDCYLLKPMHLEDLPSDIFGRTRKQRRRATLH
jgi:CheY-like chemotaxis protein